MSSDSRGFSLVELTLALGVAAFCLLAVIALLPVGMSNNRSSISETQAAAITGAIVADLRASARNSSATGLFRIPLPYSGRNTIYLDENANVVGAVNQDANTTANPPPRYRATVWFTPESGRKATAARILVTWPALADTSSTTDPSKFSGSFEVLSALDIN